ncbi:ATP synthase F1 subunit gamma [Facklamia sp. P9177]|uniref:ATP synthase F1 subunit gamma n=1 Tax=Facklamia sp. P9177 TaxID=3421945 RepID=UPI003D16E9B8
MPSLNEIKRHIASTEKTKKITNAMQMVSRNKVNHLLDMTQSYQVYIDHLRETIVQLHYTLKVTPPNFSKPEIRSLITPRKVNKIGIFLISTDKGLAGSYNVNLIKGLDEWIEEQNFDEEQELVFYTLGRTGERYCRERGYKIARSYYPLSDQPGFQEAHYFIRQLRSAYVEKECDELYLAYNHYGLGSGTNSKFGVDNLLPVVSLNRRMELDPSFDKKELISEVFLIEPSMEAVLEGLVPQYIESFVYGALLQAKTAEHFSRMIAMQSATENAKEIIEDLQLRYNRARQVKVTNEIIEIVAGAQAQHKERRK